MTLSAIDAIDHWQEEATRWKAEATRMRNRIECLRGALKSAAGRAYEVAEFRLGDDCMEWAGDMEKAMELEEKIATNTWVYRRAGR